MTIKLYDTDSHSTEFEATVISCRKSENEWIVELDRTLFFPEEGGQCSDRGTLNGKIVNHVEIKDDIIYHHTCEEFEVGSTVQGIIDYTLRFRNMQNHSGEHIICGIAHKLFGCENVGFHLGEDCVTMDLDCELTPDDIKNIEILANEAVVKNMPVTALYPSKDELARMTYRAKGEIEGDVRIVIIGDVDACACCAPHVSHTGEIGIIKIIDYMRHRGGMRFTIKCGFDALYDYDEMLRSGSEISSILSVRRNEIADGVRKILDDTNSLKAQLSEKNRKMADIIAGSVAVSDSDICVFCNDFEPDILRYLANILKEKTPGFAIALSGNDQSGYKYVIASSWAEVSDYVKTANAALSGRGGGKANMASGSFTATREDIEKYFGK